MNEYTITYPKLYEDEVILPGDILELNDEQDSVFLSVLNYKCVDNIIGICSKVEDNIITVINTGICDINTTGIICIGDKLTLSEKPGKARALKYEQNISTFKMPSIGKIIGLYQQYNRAKILLHID